MEIITLKQPFYGKDKNGEQHIYLNVYLADGKKQGHMNSTEKNFTEMKHAVVNYYLKQGNRAPKNEIAKYVTQDGFTKRVKTGSHKDCCNRDIILYDYETEHIKGPSLIMTKGK